MRCQGPTQFNTLATLKPTVNPGNCAQPMFAASDAFVSSVVEPVPSNKLRYHALRWLALPVIGPLYLAADFLVPTMTFVSPEQRDRLEYLLPTRFHRQDLYLMMGIAASEAARKRQKAYA